MRLRTIVYVVLLLIVVALLVANRSVIATSTPLNFIVARANAPFGILILIVAVLIALVDFIAHAFSRLGWQRERRNLRREIELLRERADQAEASRIRELKETVERESAALRSQLDRVLSTLPHR
ncbi:MAG: LapA family protein [Steroidobacteraceae bacterium]